MSNFNRGEWSEIYTVLSLLLCPELSIGNSNLEEITKKLYRVNRIKVYPNTGIFEYKINCTGDVEVWYNNDFDSIIAQIELNKNKHMIYDAIKNAPCGNGAFEIVGINDLLLKMTKGAPIKSQSLTKADMEAAIFDKRLGDEKSLNYSIKSSLGSPATILNASNKTNFLYEVIGLDKKYILEINSINSRTKLLDRLNYIKDKGGQIIFKKVCSPEFEYNLKMIDSNMPSYLGYALLESYLNETKDLKTNFIKGYDFADYNFGIKKLGDLLEAISFGFVPGKKWDGSKSVNGGLMIVKKNGDIIVLDLVYFRNEVINYIINETKFDSPSSTRYGMLNLYESSIDNKIYFTLNLQLRYKK